MKNSLQKNLKKLKLNSMDKQGFFARSFKWFTRQWIQTNFLIREFMKFQFVRRIHNE